MQERQQQCPDLKNPFGHLEPANFAKNAGAVAINSTLIIVLGLLQHYVPVVAASEDGNDKELARAQKSFRRQYDVAVANAPQSIVQSVLRDVFIRSLHSTLEVLAVVNTSVPLCRALSTDLAKEFNRVDAKPADDKPGVISIMKTSVLAVLLLETSIFIVDSSYDALSLVFKRKRDAAEEDTDYDDSSNSEESPPDPRVAAAARAAVISRLGNRFVSSATTIVLQAILVGAALKISNSTGAKVATLGSIAVFVGQNLRYIL